MNIYAQPLISNSASKVFLFVGPNTCHLACVDQAHQTNAVRTWKRDSGKVECIDQSFYHNALATNSSRRTISNNLWEI